MGNATRMKSFAGLVGAATKSIDCAAGHFRSTIRHSHGYNEVGATIPLHGLMEITPRGFVRYLFLSQSGEYEQMPRTWAAPYYSQGPTVAEILPNKKKEEKRKKKEERRMRREERRRK